MSADYGAANACAMPIFSMTRIRLRRTPRTLVQVRATLLAGAHRLGARAGLRPLSSAQDVVQFGPLGATLLGQVQSQPGSIPAILQHVGPLPILDWTRHFLTLGAPMTETACAGCLQKCPSCWA